MMQIRITKDEIIFPSLEKSYKQAVGVSVAANMREAIKQFEITADEVTLYMDTPVVLVPQDKLADEDPAQLYNLTISIPDEEIVVEKNEIPEYDTVLLFSVSKDLKTVIEDHFAKFEFKHISTNLFSSELKDSYKERKLYAYFYDKTMYAFAFKQGRLLFFNEYEATVSQDCAFLLLSIYKQLGYSQLKDEIVLSGEIAFEEELKNMLGEFVKFVTSE